MISVWHLGWICPVCVCLGILVTGMCRAGRNDRP